VVSFFISVESVAEKKRVCLSAEVLESIKKLGLKQLGLCESPIKGSAGNIEYLACFVCEK